MKRPRILSTLLALVIAGTAAVDGFCIYDVYGRDAKGAAAAAAEAMSEDDKEKEEIRKDREAQEGKLLQLATEGNVSYTPSQLDLDTDLKVHDSTQAIEFLQQIGDRFGIEDAANEYTVTAETDIDDARLYFLQQRFGEIPVFGSTLTMEADKDGNVRSVEGSHVNVDPDMDTEPDILVDEARKIADAYAQTKLGYVAGEYNLGSGGVVLNPKYNDKDVVLCYSYYVNPLNSSQVLAVIMVDAETGKISGSRPMVNSEMILLDSKTLPNLMPLGQLKNDVKLSVYKNSDTEYQLRSETDKIEVYVCNGEKDNYTMNDFSGLSVYSYDPNKQSWKEVDNRIPDPYAVDALANIEKVNKFFLSVYYRKGLTDSDDSPALKVYTNIYSFDGTNYRNNAAIVSNDTMIIGAGVEDDKANITKPSCAAYLDIMAHEYTHAIISNSSELEKRTYNKEKGEEYDTSIQSAIHEGYADIFGEFCEDYSDDGELNGTCDWKSLYRNYSSPTVTEYSGYTEYKTDGHDGGFLISSPVYRAAKKGVPNNKLASLYYYSIPRLTASMGFKEIRQMIEKRAAVGNAEGYIMNNFDEPMYLTDKEFEDIIDSFDEVGIPSSFTNRLMQGGTLVVYDKDDNVCSDYHIMVTRLYDRTNTPLIDEDVTKKEFKFPSELANGIYRVTLSSTDEDSELEYTYDVIINDQDKNNKSEAYEKELKLYTKFGSKEREVVLVLDVSGSMNGEPITQTKLSAQKFVKTVLGEAPATRISVVTYSSSANTLIESSSKKSGLVSTIGGLSSGGGTNIYDGLQRADDILERSKAPKKQIVLMSDGYPNEGKSENGSYAQPCIDYADDLKSKDVLIYSLGFFHSLSGSERDECSALMSAIATPGYYFEVGSAADVQFVFDDLADQVSGGNYIYIRIACPVDVLVKFNNQILSSASKTFNTRTDFGTLTFDSENEDEKDDDDDSSSKKKKKDDDEQDTDKDKEKGSTSSKKDEVKILRLKDGAEYEICITGTGKGKMDYSISYPNEDGDYTDVRKFKGVPITKDTTIATNTAKGEETELNVDSDGDGVFDMVYTAKEDSKAVLQNSKVKTIVIIVVSALLLLFVVIEILLIVKRYKSNKVCHSCGAKLANAKKFCNQCGAKAVKTRLIFPDDGRPKQKKGVIITKLVLIAIFAGSAAAVIYLYRSPATTVYKQLRSGMPNSAQQLYETAKIEDSAIQQKYLTHALNRYIDKANTAHENGKYTDEEFERLLNGAISLDVDDITDKAEEYLDSSKKDGKDSSDKSDSSSESSSDGSSESKADSSSEED